CPRRGPTESALTIRFIGTTLPPADAQLPIGAPAVYLIHPAARGQGMNPSRARGINFPFLGKSESEDDDASGLEGRASARPHPDPGDVELLLQSERSSDRRGPGCAGIRRRGDDPGSLPGGGVRPLRAVQYLGGPARDRRVRAEDG